MTDRIRLAADVPAVAEPTARTITGRIVTFGVASASQRVTITPGALTSRQPLSRVKLLIDHDLGRPVGVLTDLTITDSEASATFTLPAGAASDEALTSAQAGLRDGLSIGITVRNATRTDDGGITVTSAEIHEVSLVAVPDFADAAVTGITASTTQGDTMPTDETLTAPQTGTVDQPPQTGTVDQPPQAAPATVAASVAPAPAPAATPHVSDVTPRGLNLSAAVSTMAAAINTGSPDAIRLALADIVPAQDAAQAFIGRPDWLGELFTASPVDRPFIEAFGTPQQLTSLKGTGWRWKTRPQVAKYSGNKGDVPSNEVATEAVTWTAERWAGGWDIDRIFLDLGDPGFLESFWSAAMAEYKQASEADIAAKVITAATTSIAKPDTVLGAVKGLASEFRTIGANASTIFLAPDLFDEWATLTTAQVPFWLANVVGGVDLTSGTVDQPGGLSLKVSAALPASTVLALDKRAAVVREKTPIRINGVDIARGGVDLGFFSYGRLDLHDPRAIRKVTVA